MVSTKCSSLDENEEVNTGGDASMLRDAEG
jgi:hypothetical protein